MGQRLQGLSIVVIIIIIIVVFVVAVVVIAPLSLLDFHQWGERRWQYGTMTVRFDHRRHHYHCHRHHRLRRRRLCLRRRRLRLRRSRRRRRTVVIIWFSPMGWETLAVWDNDCMVRPSSSSLPLLSLSSSSSYSSSPSSSHRCCYLIFTSGERDAVCMGQRLQGLSTPALRVILTCSSSHRSVDIKPRPSYCCGW